MDDPAAQTTGRHAADVVDAPQDADELATTQPLPRIDNGHAPAADARREAAQLIEGLPRARPSGVKAVLSRLPFDLGLQVPENLQPLVGKIKQHAPKVDVREVVRAYICAERAHEGQLRKSGEPYIVHPVGVAETLAELGMDTDTIVAALLHDTVEDTVMSAAELASEFGDDVAMLVDGVTKLDRIQATSSLERQAESLRKMLLAMARDYRVLLIKLADRLHNMRTLHHMSRDKQERIAEETLQIYAPLAHRLGMQNFKWQLEDLAFATLHSKRYDELKAMVRERQPERDRYLDQIVGEVEQLLRGAKIRAEVSGRPKHYYSIYEKMVRRGKEFSEIYDLVGIRVIVDSVKDCYGALGMVHSRWHPVPGRFKDYIAMPKFNLYQSLHTTVVGPDGMTLEVQIRTQAMHRTAEFGVAAHWKYKQSARADHSEAQWLSQMIDMHAATDDANEFLSNMRLDLDADEVFVFTPDGDIKALPTGSTPVDFAYAIHTEVGHRTVGARVNGRLVSLEYELHNGETVEILTSRAKDASPSRDWLTFVGSSRARSKIRQWFSRERRVDAIEKGRQGLRAELARQRTGWRRLMTGSEIAAVSADMNYADVDALYRAIGEGHLAAQTVVNHLVGRLTDEDQGEEILPTTVAQPPSRGDSAVLVDGLDDLMVNLAQCCSPAPGDEILGFVTQSRGVSVHRSDCTNAGNLRRQTDRLVDVAWDPNATAMFRVTMQVDALDRKHLLRDITTVLGDLHVNILSAQVTTRRDRVAKLRFTFELADIAHLDHILAQATRVESVYDAFRVIPQSNGS
ncbi:MAG: bifunctional (p)ppGpp synthetase/guanosine-3',5'-bis(diphosphate) 3'-pyrophosphohydrolase [Actinobacteria bacterium]|nr:bifunctional (p)ppGpp synthetase/guanosine-3',5'-bis(diphosphate) 3'-pyrophosphohydrolase [Actinomycetota bacterium]